MLQQTARKNIPYTPLAFTVFIFILIFNFCGVSTITPTLTSQFVTTAGLAFSLNLGFFLLAFQVQGVRFLKFFVPSGIPVFLIPFMTVIELFSYSLRSISLFVRLFANMMAGHTLMHIISSFFLVIFLTFNYYIAFFPLVLLIAIYVLELAIAFLQGYVFLTLFCIYLNDSINPSGHLFKGSFINRIS
jgi:F-type H+-transporting ATPase subunit a